MDDPYQKFNRTAIRTVTDGRLRFEAGGLEFTVLSCQYNELPPGLQIPEHEHPCYCLTFVERSSMRTTCDDLSIENRAGGRTLFFMPPAVSHHCRFGEGETHWNLSVNFLIGGPHAMEVNERIACRAAELRYEIRLTKEMEFLLREVRRQGMSDAPLAPELLAHLLAAFLETVIQQTFPDALKNASGREALRAVFRHDRIDAIKRAMWAMVRDPNPAEILSECFGLTPRHLNRIFRKGTGRNIKAYQNDLRIFSACSLLHNSSLSISAVGEAVGFHRPGLFAAFFRKHLGCTPQEYRHRRDTASGERMEIPCSATFSHRRNNDSSY